MKKKLITLYLSWWNEFLTVDGFAQYYSLTYEKAERVILLGRKVYLKYR